MRRACRLHPRAIRRLLGPPPRIDGQELAPDVQMLLKLASLQSGGDVSLVEGRTPEQARAENVASAPIVGGPPWPMARIERLTIPGPAGEIPVRFYEPHEAPPAPG